MIGHESVGVLGGGVSGAVWSRAIPVTAFSLAQRFVGLKEIRGPVHNAHILAMLQLDVGTIEDDETPWCSAFVNYVCWILRLPRSKSLAARSWLDVGTPVIPLDTARVGFDVVVLRRGTGFGAAGPEVRTGAPGHVGFFAGFEGIRDPGLPGSAKVLVLGGNQGDQVSIAAYPLDRVLGIRRLA